MHFRPAPIVLAAALALLTALVIVAAHPRSVQAGVGPPGPNQPISEADSCTDGAGQFEVATCVLTLIGSLDGPVADGTVVVHLLDPGSSAVLGCVTGGCQIVNGGTAVSLACGVTAPSGQTPSTTCTMVSFSLATPLAACLANPAACPRSPNLNSTSATVNVSFLATPGNGGVSGGILLSQDAISFEGAGIAMLLVTASPQIIPSNGTVASVITATFACGDPTAGRRPGSFPLSTSGFTRWRGPGGGHTIANVPVIGTGQNAVCGAGLPGSFTFSSPRSLNFDNGRTTEGVGCGLGSTVSPFGGAGPIPPYSSTAPLIFTCTGAAVLAFGNGRPGDALVNVVYNSSVGGLTAVGSTLLTVIASAEPVVSISCSPQVIAPGGPGSICIASVTDPNGIAMSDLTGVTVTFTTSDPANTVVQDCGYAIAGNLNPGTTPAMVPQLSPLQPCQLLSPAVPSQVNTLLNGQATAVISAAPAASPELVTVSAGLNVYVPPSALCSVAPYIPSFFFPATTGVGLPSVTGCGTGNPVGFTGTASALSTATAGLSSTTPVVFPLAPSAGTTVTIGSSSVLIVAGGSTANPLQLTRGCNQVVITSPQGTPLLTVLGLISPQESVISIWRFGNSTKQYQAGLFADPSAPTDFAVTGGANRAPTSGSGWAQRPGHRGPNHGGVLRLRGPARPDAVQLKPFGGGDRNPSGRAPPSGP